MLGVVTPETLDRFRGLYYALAPDYPHSALLDSCGWEGKTGGLYVMAFEAETVVQLKAGALWVNGKRHGAISDKNALWAELDRFFPKAASQTTSNANPLPFEDGWIGTLAYELNHLLEPSVLPRAMETPLGLLYFARFRHRVVWQPQTGEFRILSDDPAWVARVEGLLRQDLPLPAWEEPLTTQSPQVSFSPEAFEEQVETVKDHIARGNLYQANLSLRFEVDAVPPGRLLALYHTLVTRNPSPFSGLLWTPQGVVLSNSPERLVKYTANTNLLETRPIAGTRGRGKTPEEEARIAAQLNTDEKEQAEHMMLLDLERNDLGRVAQAPTVCVPEVGVLERYSHVTHIVSQVEGQKAPQKSTWEVLEAMFPGGTITGCPKVRCMEVIHQCEPVPRGLYTGSLGYIDSRGSLDFNILIRSLFHWPDQRLQFHAGAGIVADSVPAWEYKECLRKAEVIQGVLRYDQPVVCHHA